VPAMCQRSYGVKYASRSRTAVDIAKAHSSIYSGYGSLTISSLLLKAAPMPRTTYGWLTGCAMGSRVREGMRATQGQGGG
jgi:hypothetical protein